MISTLNIRLKGFNLDFAKSVSRNIEHLLVNRYESTEDLAFQGINKKIKSIDSGVIQTDIGTSPHVLSDEIINRIFLSIVTQISNQSGGE